MTVPGVLTPQQAQVIRDGASCAGDRVGAMVLAIPALALILKLTQVFERFAV